MTNEQTIQYNKMCAEFLGWKQYVDPTKRFYGNWEPSEMLEKPWTNRVELLFFDSDWNWIMEVVEAIEKLGYWVEIVYSHLGTTKRNYPNTWCEIGKENSTDLISNDCYDRICREESVKLNKKEAVVQAINQFLIWYNNEKTSIQGRYLNANEG